MADKQDFSPQRNSFPSQHRSRKRKILYIERPPHKSPTISLREKIYSHTREFLRPSIVAIVSINSSEAAYFTRVGGAEEKYWQGKQAVTIVTIGQPVFAYFSVIGKRERESNVLSIMIIEYYEDFINIIIITYIHYYL